MQADLEDFKTGWYGLTLGVKAQEIEQLIEALQKLKTTKSHVHFRSDFEGKGGVGDIEIYYQNGSEASNLKME